MGVTLALCSVLTVLCGADSVSLLSLLPPPQTDCRPPLPPPVESLGRLRSAPPPGHHHHFQHHHRQSKQPNDDSCIPFQTSSSLPRPGLHLTRLYSASQLCGLAQPCCHLPAALYTAGQPGTVATPKPVFSVQQCSGGTGGAVHWCTGLGGTNIDPS